MKKSLIKGHNKLKVKPKTFIINNSTIIKNIIYTGTCKINLERNEEYVQITSEKPILCEIQQDNLYIKTYSKSCLLFCCFCCPTFQNKNEYSIIWKIKSKFSVDNINLNGSGEFDFKNDDLIDPILKCGVNGSGDLNIYDIDALDINIILTGSGDIKCIRTNCENAIINLNGSGNIITPKIKMTVFCTVTGSGDIKCSIDQGCTINKTITGSGSILMNN
jgi:hypothetical protein